MSSKRALFKAAETQDSQAMGQKPRYSGNYRDASQSLMSYSQPNMPAYSGKRYAEQTSYFKMGPDLFNVSLNKGLRTEPTEASLDIPKLSCYRKSLDLTSGR